MSHIGPPDVPNYQALIGLRIRSEGSVASPPRKGTIRQVFIDRNGASVVIAWDGPEVQGSVVAACEIGCGRFTFIYNE